MLIIIENLCNLSQIWNNNVTYLITSDTSCVRSFNPSLGVGRVSLTSCDDLEASGAATDKTARRLLERWFLTRNVISLFVKGPSYNNKEKL